MAMGSGFGTDYGRLRCFLRRKIPILLFGALCIVFAGPRAALAIDPGTTVITHGFIPTESKTIGASDWTYRMAYEILCRFGSGRLWEFDAGSDALVDRTSAVLTKMGIPFTHVQATCRK